MTVRIGESLEGIDWAQAKADLAADDFDNGRGPRALRMSFEQSQHVAIARDGDRVVGFYLPVERAFSPVPGGTGTPSAVISASCSVTSALSSRSSPSSAHSQARPRYSAALT